MPLFAASQFLHCEKSCIHFRGQIEIHGFDIENKGITSALAEVLWYRMCSSCRAADAASVFGGMLMSFVKTLCLVALVAMSAAAAHAGSIGTDPKVTINCTKNCPGVANNFVSHLGDPMFSPPLGFKATDPLTIPYSVGGVFDFTYEGPDVYLDPANSNALKKYLYVFIEAPIPVGTMFDCGGTVFLDCGPIYLGNGAGFDFTLGSLMTGEQISITEQPLIGETPEPSTMLLFLSLGPAIGFAKKRWNVRHSA